MPGCACIDCVDNEALVRSLLEGKDFPSHDDQLGPPPVRQYPAWLRGCSEEFPPTSQTAPKRRRRRNSRYPSGTPVVSVHVNDHDEGGRPVPVQFTSPDGKRWKTYAYWPKAGEPSEGYLIDFSGDEPRVVGRTVPE